MEQGIQIIIILNPKTLLFLEDDEERRKTKIINK